MRTGRGDTTGTPCGALPRVRPAMHADYGRCRTRDGRRFAGRIDSVPTVRFGSRRGDRRDRRCRGKLPRCSRSADRPESPTSRGPVPEFECCLRGDIARRRSRALAAGAWRDLRCWHWKARTCASEEPWQRSQDIAVKGGSPNWLAVSGIALTEPVWQNRHPLEIWCVKSRWDSVSYPGVRSQLLVWVYYEMGD